jgi:hypothetical protein
MKHPKRVLLLIGFGIIPSLSFAQEASGNSSATDTPPTQSTTLPADSGTATLPSPDALAAVQQQRVQLTAQFSVQLQSASPEERLVLIGNFRQQLDALLAPLQPPPLTLEQQSQQAAQQQLDQQTLLQSLPVEQQQAFAAMQHRQALALQLANATPEERLAIIGQIHQLTDSQAAPPPAPGQTLLPDPADPAQSAFLAALPADQQAAVQAMAQRQQAIQAAMQLSPDQRATALQAIQAQAVSVQPSNPPAESTSTTASPSSNSDATTSSASSNATSQP